MWEQLSDRVTEVMDAGRAIGLAAAVVDRYGNTLWQETRGLRDKDRGLPIDGNTIFGLASVTKSFTALAALQLAEKGVISLDDPANKYLPEFNGVYDGQPVLIRQLLSHTGGYSPVYRRCMDKYIERLGTDPLVTDVGLSREIAEAGGRDVARALDAQTRIGAPGQYFSYCNDGFGLVSEIIRLKGDCPSYADYVREHILEPLGMSRSNAEFIKPARDDNHSVLYQYKNGALRGNSDYTNRAFVLGGGGALKSTLNDMKKYLTMLLNDGRGVVSKYSAEQMRTPLTEYSPVSWYGLGLYSKRLGSALIWEHGGSLPGVSSSIAFCPENGVAAVVLCNTEDVSAGALSEMMLEAALGLKPEPVRAGFPACRWELSQVENARGRYASGEGEGDCFELDGLTVIKGDSRREAVPIGRNLLRLQGRFGDTFIRFLSGEDGVIYAARYGSRVFPKI